MGGCEQSPVLERLEWMLPTTDEQIAFLVKLQRLLAEGVFVASYKFALLLALADLSVEKGDDTGAILDFSVEMIAEKFIKYYWRQAVPYPLSAQTRFLQQNTGKQAAILNILRAARGKYGESLPAIANPSFLDTTRPGGRPRRSTYASLETPDRRPGAARLPVRELRKGPVD